MHIAGGLYRELCCVPSWDALYGSGGRAAAAVSNISPRSTLHTYAENIDNPGVTLLRGLGLELKCSPRPSSIVFAYFHPLSRPHVHPSPDMIERLPAIKVSGDAVLRFGFLEGDAVIDAYRAVYDPQTWRDPPPFSANGSVARELAVVLNELELRSATGLDDLNLAASHLMESQGVAVVVAKMGTRGAIVFERGDQATRVPAYRSSRVFKIGTGDVFSAIFAHHWAERFMSAVDAADIASRSVATYCSSGCLPLDLDVLRNLTPVKYTTSGVVAIEGALDTIGQRYTMEESRYVLRELGTDVTSLALDGIYKGNATAMLIIANGLNDELYERVQQAKAADIPIVVLCEGGARADAALKHEAGTTVTNDFVSALYFAAWAAAERA